MDNAIPIGKNGPQQTPKVLREVAADPVLEDRPKDWRGTPGTKLEEAELIISMRAV
jgi:hypothetical protein